MSEKKNDEFKKIWSLCRKTAYLFMRKDGLNTFYKNQTGRTMTLPVAEAYKKMQDGCTHVSGHIHFIYFPWKIKSASRSAPRNVCTRLKYLAFPATYNLKQLHDLYERAYGTIPVAELHRCCRMAFPKPTDRSSDKVEYSEKFVIPPISNSPTVTDIYRNNKKLDRRRKFCDEEELPPVPVTPEETDFIPLETSEDVKSDVPKPSFFFPTSCSKSTKNLLRSVYSVQEPCDQKSYVDVSKVFNLNKRLVASDFF